MTQRIVRTGGGTVTLGTLASGASSELLNKYETALTERSVLLEYEAHGFMFSLELSEITRVLVCLIDGDLSDADLQLILDNIVQKDAPEDYARQQRLKGIGVCSNFVEVSSTNGKFMCDWHLRAKFGKGVPFEEINGWKVVVFNDNGSALTTGGFCAAQQEVNRYAHLR